jgi:hypothetical protein
MHSRKPPRFRRDVFSTGGFAAAVNALIGQIAPR